LTVDSEILRFLQAKVFKAKEVSALKQTQIRKLTISSLRRQQSIQGGKREK